MASMAYALAVLLALLTSLLLLRMPDEERI